MEKDTSSVAVKLDSLSEVNDLGKPWRYEEDGLTVTRSAVWSPPGCHPVGCGLKLYTNKDGKLVKVEGDENHPVTQGRLCVRCIALQDYVYNPDRLTHCMKRDPARRGDPDAWEVISLDEALDILKENYDRITSKYGRESIVQVNGTGREGGTNQPLPADCVLGTPNSCYAQSGYACYVPRCSATIYNTGIMYPEFDYAACLPGRYDDPEYQIPECLVLWGKHPLESNPDGFFGHSVVDLMQRGTRLITVDPRVTWLSSRADYHLQIRPGTDTALGMAMLDVIIKEDLYDHNFVEKWCYGFEQLAERVATMPPERAAEICGINAEDIRGAARMYATAKPAGMLWGLAVDQKTNGVQNGLVIIDLEAITGNFDRPGGQLALEIGTNAQFSDTFGYDDPEWRKDKMIGMKEYPAYCSILQQCHCDLTLQAMETDDPYPIRFAWINSSNVMANTAAEPRRWEKALKRMEFVGSLDCFMTPTMQACGDLIFPCATVAERDATVMAQYGASPLVDGITNKAIEHVAPDVLGDLEFDWVAGHKLHPEWWEKYDTYYDFINDLRFYGRSTFEEEREKVYKQASNRYYKYEDGGLRFDGQPGFMTPTGRIELYSTMFEQFGDDPLPYYEEPIMSKYRDPKMGKVYPYVLTSGARTFTYFHSEQRQIPFLREINPNPEAEINPKLAREKGIADGQWVRIWNQHGECFYKAKISQIVKEDVIHCRHGWWFPERDAHDNGFGPYDTFRSNVNNLVPHFHFGKLGMGAPFKENWCDIEPIEESFDTDMDEIWAKFKREDQ